ncbi:hypothetical protein AVEN_152972-1 [Araneus ventricosus]|uniref:Uncharacterized protein n=1 Tax=Araneus ventricosus TaxID=182803 RepID=A0A4Y2AEL7_ARAVE|nr:hypothetical protein AVEN_152972-1 [Araneus ventricosus]
MLDHLNCYVQSFKSAMNKISLEFKVVILADKTLHGEHVRRFNVPAKDEVALIMVGEQQGARDIILEERSGNIKNFLIRIGLVMYYSIQSDFGRGRRIPF